MRWFRNTQLSPVLRVVGPVVGVLLGRVVTGRQALVLLAVAVPLAVWDFRNGVFDTDDGGIVLRRWGPTRRFTAAEEPTLVVSPKRRFGWRLDIKTVDGQRTSTALSWWRQPDLDGVLVNAAVRVSGERVVAGGVG